MNTELSQPKNHPYAPLLNSDKNDIDRRVLKVTQRIIETLDQDFQMEDLALCVDLSSRQLERLFRRDLRMTPKQFFQAARLSLACQLLVESFLSVKQISVRIGFQDHRHFLRIFKEQYKMTPTEFRQHSGSVNC